ncbi:MAG: hypothetical protein QOH28_1582 [Actinomycetota bacterium]|jgi:hypothetical protein|nr:hypothetical protein [Actinomycetota bacterium]
MPAPFEARGVGHRAAIPVDRVDQVAHDPTQLLGRVLAADVHELGFDPGDRRSAFGCARVRDHRRMPLGDLPTFERGRDLRKVFQLAGQFDVPARDALVDPTRRPQRGRGIEEPVDAPVARSVIRGDLFQPRGFCASSARRSSASSASDTNTCSMILE